MNADDSRFSPLPAPGRLRLVQDLINTRRVETGSDRLDSPPALAFWLSSRDLLAPDAELDDETWRQTLEMREELRQLLQRDGEAALANAELERLNAAVGDVRPLLRFAPDGSLELVAVDGGWRGAVDRLVLLIFEEMLAGRWRRLKVCRNEECQLVFYDSSSNRAGKWCTVRRCGNRINARRYRRRGGPTHLRPGRVSFRSYRSRS